VTEQFGDGPEDSNQLPSSFGALDAEALGSFECLNLPGNVLLLVG
jgi:hypothetical protein